MQEKNLVKIGGISAIIWVALQIVGNLLHPKLTHETADAMAHIAHSDVWTIAHIILIFDYFLILPIMVGIAAALKVNSWVAKLVLPLTTVAVTVGVIQVAMHPTALKILADNYISATDLSIQTYLITLYETVWKYNLVLEITHFLIIDMVIIMVGIAMLKESRFRKWVAWLGIGSGVFAMIGMLVGEVFMKSSMIGDLITFGIGLLPLAVWLVTVGIILIRLKFEQNGE